VLRRSPFAHRRADLVAASSARIRFSELPFLTMISLRVELGSAAADRVETVLGSRLPGPGTVSAAAAAAGAGLGRSVLWLGPDEWLVVGPDGDAGELGSLLAAALAGGPGSTVDVSAGYAILVLAGPSARELLEKGCTLDLHPRAFTTGQCAGTTLARGQMLLWQVGAEVPQAGPAYRLLVRPSFADYFTDWLTDAAAEF
jgi:sarcosine oxidase subunit gamma